MGDTEIHESSKMPWKFIKNLQGLSYVKPLNMILAASGKDELVGRVHWIEGSIYSHESNKIMLLAKEKPPEIIPWNPGWLTGNPHGGLWKKYTTE